MDVILQNLLHCAFLAHWVTFLCLGGAVPDAMASSGAKWPCWQMAVCSGIVCHCNAQGRPTACKVQQHAKWNALCVCGWMCGKCEANASAASVGQTKRYVMFEGMLKKKREETKVRARLFIFTESSYHRLLVRSPYEYYHVVSCLVDSPRCFLDCRSRHLDQDPCVLYPAHLSVFGN